MQIIIGADHRGFELKNSLKSWLQSGGHDVVDVGATELDKDDDYPDYGIKVAKAVAEQPDSRVGISICGSGAGMAVVADKVPGIRASLIHDPKLAAAARHDDNINVLALGSDYISDEEAQAVVDAFLNSQFSQEDRHVRRISKIKDYEQNH